MTFSSDKLAQRIISQENKEEGGGGEVFVFCFCFSLSHDLDAPQRHRWTDIRISEK